MPRGALTSMDEVRLHILSPTISGIVCFYSVDCRTGDLSHHIAGRDHSYEYLVENGLWSGSSPERDEYYIYVQVGEMVGENLRLAEYGIPGASGSLYTGTQTGYLFSDLKHALEFSESVKKTIQPIKP